MKFPIRPDYCYFSYGYPVEQSGWDYLKKVFQELKENPEKECILTDYFIRETFSPIQETLAGRNIASSEDQFKSACKINGIDFFEDIITRDFKIRANRTC